MSQMVVCIFTVVQMYILFTRGDLAGNAKELHIENIDMELFYSLPSNRRSFSTIRDQASTTRFKIL